MEDGRSLRMSKCWSLTFCCRGVWARKLQAGRPHLIQHEQADGLGGLDPDAKVAFSVGRQDVALVVDDLEQEVCEAPCRAPSPPAPPRPPPPKLCLAYACDTSGGHGEISVRKQNEAVKSLK